ncbi:hypothetical protein NE237_026453 [Protea cynaroides]|uniref:Aluminum-activated malate transporter n=1 Tax=Protea cynaroides TaxID=273540 RepID=A0A9Q0K1H2_9MAGN|nr:hypothetical protein NE237_026453 [Protea cynaroides]
MTVVVVFKFTAGATLYKGVNRGLGTITACLLAFLIEFVADKTGLVGRAIFIGIAVFLIGAATTFTRFIPSIKKNYNYGFVIFLLTFNLITVSSYRVDDVSIMASQRFYTINCDRLWYLPFHQSSDFSELALYASWETRHLRYCHRYPQQYVKLGAVLHHFGYTVVALHGCLQSEIQTPHSVRALFRDPSVRVAVKQSELLMELADSIRQHRRCSPKILSNKIYEALQDLNTVIKSESQPFLASDHNKPTNLPESNDKKAEEQFKDKIVMINGLEFFEALPFAAFASLLVETVARIDLVIEEVEELGRLAWFTELRPGDENIVIFEGTPRKNTADLQLNFILGDGNNEELFCFYRL